MSEMDDTAVARSKETLFFTDYTDRAWTGPGADFAASGAGNEAAFRANFEHALDAGLRVEASTDNLSCPVACERISEFAARQDVKSLKVLAILRDPVDRIISEFEHTLKLGWQRPDLMASLRAEERRVREGWHPLFRHVMRSRYGSQLKPFRAAFGDNLLILDYHRLNEPESFRKIACFIGRDEKGLSRKIPRVNARAVHARPRAQQLLRNDKLRAAAKMIVPKGMRAGIRSMIRGRQLERYVPTKEERNFITGALAEEIAACRNDPEIPTDRWCYLLQE
jgi:hypothetical protein